MSAPAQQLEQSRGHWLPIHKVAELTSTSVSAWRHKAAKLFAQGLAMQGPPPSGKGRAIWWFDPRADRRLSYLAGQTADDREIKALSGKHPAHLVLRAAAKLRHLRDYWMACCYTDKRAAAAQVIQQAKADGTDGRISVRGLQRWDHQYRRDGVDGLVDRFGSPGGDSGPSPRSPQAVEMFYDLYHTEQRLTIKHCHGVVLRQAQRGGWHWPASMSATEKWLQAHDDRALTLLMRHIEDYQHRAMGYIEQDYD